MSESKRNGRQSQSQSRKQQLQRYHWMAFLVITTSHAVTYICTHTQAYTHIRTVTRGTLVMRFLLFFIELLAHSFAIRHMQDLCPPCVMWLKQTVACLSPCPSVHLSVCPSGQPARQPVSQSTSGPKLFKSADNFAAQICSAYLPPPLSLYPPLSLTFPIFYSLSLPASLDIFICNSQHSISQFPFCNDLIGETRVNRIMEEIFPNCLSG